MTNFSKKKIISQKSSSSSSGGSGITIGDLPFIVPNPLLSSGGDDTIAIQDAIDRLGTDSKGVVYLRGKDWNISSSIILPLDKDVMIDGYGAKINLIGTGYSAFRSICNSMTQAADALQHKLTIKGLIFIGNGDHESVGIDVRGTYGSRFESCHFISLGTGILATFCLDTVIKSCFITLGRKDGFVLRSAAGVWTGANNNNSQSNCSVIDNCRVYGNDKMFSHYKFYSSSECKLTDSISEGLRPIDCIVHNTLSNPNHGYEQFRIAALGDTTPNVGYITILGETVGPYTNITTATNLGTIANDIRALPKCIAGVYNVLTPFTDSIFLQCPATSVSVPDGNIAKKSGSNYIYVVFDNSNTAFTGSTVDINGGTGYLSTVVQNFISDNIHVEVAPYNSVYKIASNGLTTISRNYYVLLAYFVDVISAEYVLISENYYLAEYGFKATNAVMRFNGFGGSGGNTSDMTNPIRYGGTPPNYKTYQVNGLAGKIFDYLAIDKQLTLINGTSVYLVQNNTIHSQHTPNVQTISGRGTEISFASTYVRHVNDDEINTPGYSRPIPNLKSITQNEDSRDSFLMTASTGETVRVWFSVSGGVATLNADVI